MGKLRLANISLILGSFAVASIFVFLLCFLFNPMWETNDDVGMSMVAHGYGIATAGTPNLIFSNVLWGYLIRFIPEVNGVLGYSIATLGVLVIVGTVLFYGFYRLGLGYIASFSAMALILVRPVLFPQFTINAGLLMVGAIICWHLFARQNDRRALAIGCLLAFFSFMVRSQEFLLVLIVALPLLTGRDLLQQRTFQIALLMLISAIIVSIAIDHQAYQGGEWNAFKELKPAISSIVDFGAGEYLKLRPDILDRYGYSINDIDLLKRWFFVDPTIANPEKLKGMLDELGPLPTQSNSLANALRGVTILWHPIQITTFLAALLVAVLRPSWRLLMVWVLCVLALFILGLLGRPGILRIYVPLVSLLVVAPFLRENISIWRNHFATGILLVVAILNMHNTFSDAQKYQVSAEQTRQDLMTFPNYPIVIWGGGFPYENIYPVLRVWPSAMQYNIVSLGGFTLAPFANSYVEQQQGRGVIEMLIKENGVYSIANEQWYAYLEIYCRKHLHGKLKNLSSKRYGVITLNQHSCLFEE
mgnify:CR=1 FL=1